MSTPTPAGPGHRRRRAATTLRLGPGAGSDGASPRLSALRTLDLLRVLLMRGLAPLLVPARHRRASGPVRLRRALETLGGGWIKLGQLLALRFDVLPEAYCLELFDTLNRVPPFQYAEVERVIRDELGQEIPDLFSSFEAKPFGSASIGQVHDAVLHDGRRVAVKVQRPGIDALLMCDVALMRRVAAIVDRTPLLGAIRSRDVVDELARWTREELDYTVEAANAIEMRANVRDEDTEHDPEIHLDHTSRRVLTAERLDGVPLVDIIRELRADRDRCTQRLRAAGYDLDRAAENVVWNFLNQAYAVGVFHGDLHPANVLLLAGNRIGYVDFGIVGRIPPEVQESLGRYAMSLFGGDASAAVDQLLRWLRPSARTDAAAARSHMLGLTERFLDDLEHAPARRREVLARFQVDLLSAARQHRLVADPAIVLYTKVVLAMDAVTSELAPSLDLQPLHERFVSELLIEGFESAASPPS
ncbi:MAG: AarF/UbiB family protein [Solirubrobacteraceae bacterium]|nr:AarF/UbiB family protein [Solirubrobacteraceae bacterium]